TTPPPRCLAPTARPRSPSTWPTRPSGSTWRSCGPTPPPMATPTWSPPSTTSTRGCEPRRRGRRATGRGAWRAGPLARQAPRARCGDRAAVGDGAGGAGAGCPARPRRGRPAGGPDGDRGDGRPVAERVTGDCGQGRLVADTAGPDVRPVAGPGRRRSGHPLGGGSDARRAAWQHRPDDPPWAPRPAPRRRRAPGERAPTARRPALTPERDDAPAPEVRGHFRHLTKFLAAGGLDAPRSS